MPRPVRAAQILLFLGAVFTVLVVVGALLSLQFSVALVVYLVVVVWPGAAGFVIAVRLSRGGRKLFWFAMVVCGFWILEGLASLGGGDPRGITQLIIPVGVVLLLTRPPARAFLA
jgi:hypothetical protein